MHTPCELHVKAKNITALVAYGSALPVIPGGTIHGRQVPLGFSVVTVKQIFEVGGQNEKLELDFVGGDGEHMLGQALHGCILWCKAHIILIGNTSAPLDPPSPLGPDNDDDDDFGGPSSLPPPAPSPSSPPRARSTRTPPVLAKGKNIPHPSHGWNPKKWKVVMKKRGHKKKLAYEMTNEELAEHTLQEVIDHFKLKVPEKRVPIDAMLAAKLYDNLSDAAKRRIKLPSDFDRTLIKSHQKMKKCGKTVPQLGTQHKILEPLRVQTDQEKHVAKFMQEMGFTYVQAAGQEDIPVAQVVGLP
jgi:hypothetical protein